ncbi:MAG: hypothetical protein A2131_02280 [Candidatus Sungbacteria bacterium GWC2_49_10]|uniref:Glycosyl transferase family 1 domain-containing protein n=1 Tax=Candidatus Sungbacteria bacterium GWC2_49_10 TaxID=1802263 RepID=A0A1G2K4R0_9BACT|nr:MAG: Glycosyl transferase, group 1 [Parcubacteria group bacterium GW2011_GWB1_50_9]KKW24990.1 MAG: Glycosyl transferase, group 1 [candidate division Kazan bacterium GW2011_GWC1_52_13]OGZ93480.1 MAG: hypothetical protein A2131_02280 [Candidatus Sungbacteria bacterium GWC2_49_10]
MKIAIIVHRLTFKGGTQRQALELARNLLKKGHTVKLYAFEVDRKNTYTDLINGLDVITLSDYDPHRVESFLGFFTRPSYLAWWFKRNRNARRLAHLIDPDTDILNPHAFYVYAVSYYFKKEIRDIPAVWMLNTMTFRTWKFWRAKELNPDFSVSFFKKLFYRIMDWTELRLFINPHRIVVLNSINKALVQKYMGKEAIQVRTGADLNRFMYRAREGRRNKKARLFGVGALFEHRRFEDAIEAVKILNDRGYDVSLDIVGDTAQRSAYYEMLKKLVRKWDLGARVRFLGIISEEELVRVYQGHDIGVFPSILHPGNLATLEAMACGAPVIVSKGASLHEMLTDGENALLVNEKSSEDIAEAVEQLISHPELYRTLSKNGRRFVENNISWQKYAEAMESIFRVAASRNV